MVKECKVTNKSTGPSVYRLSTGFRREFAPLETRMIPVTELEELVQVPGGREMIENFLMIHDPEVLLYLLNEEVQDEYWLTKDQLPQWMESCTLDEFKDALDLAPRGTIELIKDYAVKSNLNDYSKRQAMKEQLDFDVSTAIQAASQSTSGGKASGTPVRRTPSTIQKPTMTAVVSKPEE